MADDTTKDDIPTSQSTVSTDATTSSPSMPSTPTAGKVTPIWSRLEKLLERGESATSSAAHSSPPLDIAAILMTQIELERTALELSRVERADRGLVIKSPPNVVLARQLSDYIRSRVGLPSMDGVKPS